MNEQEVAFENHQGSSSAWPAKQNRSSRVIDIDEVLMGMEPSTSSPVARTLYPVAATNSGFPVDSKAKDCIRQIRLKSGLTWETLATILKVSRRSLHSWANGVDITNENFAHLQAVHQAILDIDKGDVSQNRMLLLATLEGKKPIELLRDGEFDEAKRLIESAEFVQPRRKKLSDEEKAVRDPLPPKILAHADQTPVHQPLGSKRMKMRARKP